MYNEYTDDQIAYYHKMLADNGKYLTDDDAREGDWQGSKTVARSLYMATRGGDGSESQVNLMIKLAKRAQAAGRDPEPVPAWVSGNDEPAEAPCAPADPFDGIVEKAALPPTHAAPIHYSSILAMLHKAILSGRARPRIRLANVTLYVAGERSRYEGDVMVVSPDREDGEWYGRITKESALFVPNIQVKLPMAVRGDLDALNTDAETTASHHGHLSGECCFCTRELTDPKSKAVGYGPVCAGHYGLPWGE